MPCEDSNSAHEAHKESCFLYKRTHEVNYCVVRRLSLLKQMLYRVRGMSDGFSHVNNTSLVLCNEKIHYHQFSLTISRRSVNCDLTFKSDR